MSTRESFEIGTNKRNQLFRALLFIASRFRAEDMVPNVALDHFIHQSIDGATRGGNQLQEIGTFVLGIQCVFNSSYLAADTPDACQQFAF